MKRLTDASKIMSSDEAAEHAAHLEAEASSMPAGKVQRDLLLKANSYRSFASIKRSLRPPKTR